MPNIENTQSNYTLLKLIRTGISPLSAMIGTSAYYGQLIGNPVLGTLNALLFSKKLGIDIWNLNKIPNNKTKLLNSSKKILLGLGTIGLVNYAKFTNNDINPNPTESPTTTTTIVPFPPELLTTNNEINKINNLMDWDTYLSLNSYGIANLIAGVTELIPNRFEAIRKIANMATGGALISSGVAMGINNDFNNAYAIPTIVSGASEIIHNLLPTKIINNTEMQETNFFTNEDANLLINNIEQEYERQITNYGSSDTSDISDDVFGL